MSTAFDTIITTMAALLASGTPVAAQIETDDVDSIPEDVATAVELLLSESEPSQLGGIQGNPVDWITRVRVTCHARAVGTGATARSAVNALVQAVHARYMADTTLGLGPDVHIGAPSLNWDAARKAQRLAACELLYTVTHRTSGTALT